MGKSFKMQKSTKVYKGPLVYLKDRKSLTFDAMPIEVYHFYIFSYLNIDELLNLKLVSKKLCSIVKSFNITDLWLQSIHAKSKWFTSNKSFNLKRLIENSKLLLLKNSFHFFANLKYLKIDHIRHPISVEYLNRFTKLQVLDFGLNFSDYSFENFHILQLPELRALSVSLTVNDYNNLVLHTPKLHSLSVQINTKFVEMTSGPIHLIDPSTVKFLELSTYESSLQIFENLESLGLNYAEDLNIGNLMTLKKLKKLIIYKASSTKKLKELFVSKRPGLQMIYLGVKIKNISKFSQFENCGSEINFQITNYKDLECDLFPNVIFSYDDFLVAVPKNQPVDFFRKYANILKLHIHSKVEDENRLVNFIKNSRRLSILILKDSLLSQEFYNQLPKISSLFWLLTEDDVALDLKFILNMEYLTEFDTNQDVTLDRSLDFNKLKYLNQINFRVKDNKFTITKEATDRYHIKYSFTQLPKMNKTYFDLDDLFTLFSLVRGDE